MTSAWARVLLTGLVGVAAGALAAAAAGGVIGAGRQSAEPATAEAADVPTPTPTASDEEALARTEAYLDTVEPLAREGGRLVEQVLKPAVRALGEHGADAASPSAELPGDAVTSMQEVHDLWILAEPPRSLEEAHALFAIALDRYEDVAERLADAGPSPDQPTALHDELVELGSEADDLYDRAARLVQDHLAAHGGEPVAWLPQTGDS